MARSILCSILLMTMSSMSGASGWGELETSQMFFSDEVQIKLQKMLDGKSVYCKKDAHLGKAAYAPADVKVSVSGDELQVKIVVSHLECGKENERFRWEPRLPLDPIVGKTRDGQPTLTRLKDLEMVVADTTYKTIRIAPVANVAQAEIIFVFSATELLNHREEGQERIFLEFFERAIAEVEYNGEVLKLGRRGGGAYSILFTLNQGAAGYEVRDLTVVGR